MSNEDIEQRKAQLFAHLSDLLEEFGTVPILMEMAASLTAENAGEECTCCRIANGVLSTELKQLAFRHHQLRKLVEEKNE